MKKPSSAEAEHIARSAYERLKSIEADKQKKPDDDGRRKAQELHYRNCPKCGMNLGEIEYKKAGIASCSGCQGA